MLSSFIAPEAEEDIINLRKYLFEENEEEAFFSILQKIEKTISLLCEFPEIGIQQQGKNIRKIPVPNTKIILIFRAKKNILQIIRIYHSSRKWIS